MAIRPTFYGFQMAKSALSASQRNIDVTGQNIANINTDGYSRQRANLSAIGTGGLEWKYPVSPSANVGLGVNIDSIQRIRDQFLDARYRKENGDNSRYAAIQDVLGSVQTNVDEFVTDSTDHIFTSFMNALQSFQTNADEVEASSLVRSSAEQFVRTLNSISSNINQIASQQYQQLSLIKDSVNNIANSLDDLNKEIRMQAILGPVSNELLDKRDMLLDKLSTYGEVKVVEDPTHGIWVYFGNGDVGDDSSLPDSRLTDSLLVRGDTVGHNTLDFEAVFNDPNQEGPVRLTWSADNETGNPGGDFMTTTGQIFAYYEMINGMGDLTQTDENLDLATKGIPYYMNIINTFTADFAKTFNDLNTHIYNESSTNPTTVGGPLFATKDGSDTINAGNITISQDWQNDPQFLLTTTSEFANPNSPDYTPGAARNDNVLRMIAAIRDETREFTDPAGNKYTGSFQQYVGYLNSEISIEINYNDSRKNTSDILLQSADDLRSSIMNVSEDEEAMNLTMYQKSYNAAARYMTVLDEMLNTIINGMGVVGR